MLLMSTLYEYTVILNDIKIFSGMLTQHTEKKNEKDNNYIRQTFLLVVCRISFLLWGKKSKRFDTCDNSLSTTLLFKNMHVYLSLIGRWCIYIARLIRPQKLLRKRRFERLSTRKLTKVSNWWRLLSRKRKGNYF
jgi:hypothetical protein